MSKHTASPWRTEFRRHAKLEEGSHVHVLMDSEGYNIALISSWVNNSDTAAEAIANARLISAAPELLEELTMILESFGGGSVMTFSDEDIERIAAVVAKATDAPLRIHTLEAR